MMQILIRPRFVHNREDMSDALDRIAPEDRKGNLYRHSAEGLDDMPAHIKSALVGASVTVPITNGKLNTGTWQGIWYVNIQDCVDFPTDTELYL